MYVLCMYMYTVLNKEYHRTNNINNIIFQFEKLNG